MSGDQRIVQPRYHEVGGASCRGALHERRGLPNQDAIDWSQCTPGGLPIVLAIADGHGGAAYFRSGVGAACAVEVAVAIGEELAASAKDLELSAVKREVEERLPQQITRLWSERVARHLAEHPVTEEEVSMLEAHGGARARERFDWDEYSAYGATLLFTVVTSRFMVFGQLGDGDLLWVDASGETTILFKSDGEVGEETASLCMKDAFRFLRMKVVPLQDNHPPLILVATDGYSKSFVNDGEFLRIGGDYLRMVRDRGVMALANELPSFLLDASTTGSGDDITLGFIRCSEAHDHDSIVRQQAELNARFDEKADRGEAEMLKVTVEEFQGAVQRLALEVSALLERMHSVEVSSRWSVVSAWLGGVAILFAGALLWLRLRSGH